LDRSRQDANGKAKILQQMLDERPAPSVSFRRAAKKTEELSGQPLT
jgi:hypothetical protein